MHPPRVSVVVSSYERPEGLARLLDALAAQTVADVEVVVVDNGSGPATAAAIERATRAHPRLSLTVVRHDRTRGPAGGRNSGWRAASAPLIAFTDDDCVPAPDWLAQLLATAAQHPGAIVQGRVIADPAADTSARLWLRIVEVDAADGRYETANILYRRALLHELGGFDEGFGLRPAGEDTDLGWAARRQGVATVFAPEAVVAHEVVLSGPRASLANETRWAACARLFRRHPEARRAILTHRIFWDVWHYLLWRSLLSLAAPRPLRALIVIRHLQALDRRAHDLGAGPGAIPSLLARDVAGSAAMLAASIRERTPLL